MTEANISNKAERLLGAKRVFFSMTKRSDRCSDVTKLQTNEDMVHLRVRSVSAHILMCAIRLATPLSHAHVFNDTLQTLAQGALYTREGQLQGRSQSRRLPTSYDMRPCRAS